MPIPSLYFIAASALLFYLGTFIFFAILRVITGISIQRIGFSSLRRISFTPKEGISIHIRGLGLSLHRPTFAQPTWLSVVLSELTVTIDLKFLGSKRRKSTGHRRGLNGTAIKGASPQTPPQSPAVSINGFVEEPDEYDEPRSRTWEQLTELKERIKRLHRKIRWIRMVDVVATSSSCIVVDVGSVQVGSFTMAVDTRRKTVDRARLFQHKKAKAQAQHPAEWIFTVRSVLFTPDGRDSSEILDHCTLNIHGLLYQELDGLRDASIALKLGRLSLPYDEIQACVDKFRHIRSVYGRRPMNTSDVSFTEVVEELERPGSREENIVRTVSDSKEFVSSILRGIQEIQFAISFFGITQRVAGIRAKNPVYINTSMKELSLDVLRLDPRTPVHRMYFSPQDIAHQALVAAVGISVGVDDGHDNPDRLLYIPMATATMRTTLPSKTIQISRGRSFDERNTNILYANLVFTSPSLDLDPKHLPLVLAVIQARQDGLRAKPRRKGRQHNLISRLLPKANIKISIHEPVIRVSLPPRSAESREADEFDLLISMMSLVSLDLDSSHSSTGELHYSITSSLRITAHHLYYQTNTDEKHNLLLTDNMELKVHVSASPEISVAAEGNLKTFSVYMVRPEICEGVRQITTQLMLGRDGTPTSSAPKQSFLRRIPAWLRLFNFQGSDIKIEVAGYDTKVSNGARGLALQLQSWTTTYKADRNDDASIMSPVRRATSSIRHNDDSPRAPSPSPARRRQGSMTDGRRLVLHFQGFDGYVVEDVDMREPDPFFSMPRLEVAFSTSTDTQGPIFHINSVAREVYGHYSLYRHYAIGIAVKVLHDTFLKRAEPSSPLSPSSPWQEKQGFFTAMRPNERQSTPIGPPEITTIDFRSSLIQLKAAMPSDPPLMVQISGLEAGKHRWSPPFFRMNICRLYSRPPKVGNSWSRLISIKTLRLDFREQRRKQGVNSIRERTIDIATEAIRLGVPHQLVIHRIFDNLTNIVKTIKQLHHRFVTESEEDILEKGPEGPKHVPRIAIRSQVVLFEIEDDSFEWKLGAIYRLGLIEQQQRLARDEAFRLKKKALEQNDSRKGSRKGKGHVRSRSRPNTEQTEENKMQANTPKPRGRSRSPANEHDRHMRYDTDGKCGISGEARRNIQQAQERLDIYNSQSWKRRIDRGLKFQNRAMRDIRSMFWGIDELPDDVEQGETILEIPQRPALASLLVSDFGIIIDQPSFPIDRYPEFLHNIGKGMPKDMQYGLLIPMNLNVSMGEARVTLRDYPLPLLHVPAIRPGQSPRLPSLSFTTDFVIAEEFQGNESTRMVQVRVVPPETTESQAPSKGLTIDVPRTVSPVKTFSDIKVDINTSHATKLTWGTSYQPAIQDMMQVIEGFTKPPVDPSERVGFWDKIRLNFHSRVNVAWKGDGDVHLILKGSRDPYMVTDQGAGFVMCWRNDVRWSICQDPDPRRFMTVDSGEYVLAIPDFSHYARHSPQNNPNENDSMVSSNSSNLNRQMFKKVIMKLSGNVSWTAGLVFERDTGNGQRSFDFKPHYEVILKNPDHSKNPLPPDYDAYRGFRSNHIHMSIAIAAPVNRDWSFTNLEPSSNYNSIHLTPRFFTHFFSWWSMFQGVMSLPVRQGNLWPGPEKSSKKFARHLATMKYNLLLSPVYLSHIYKHKDAEEYDWGLVAATGIKMRLNSFMLDLHQRREEFRMPVPGLNKQSRTSKMKINQTQLDFISADIRAVSATIRGTNTNDVVKAPDEVVASMAEDIPPEAADMSQFNIPDNDFTWIDMDDFVELDWILPVQKHPETSILPLAFAPRFSYFRQTDHQHAKTANTEKLSTFGNEPTHFCVMSARNDPRRVQIDLLNERIKHIEEQLLQNERAVGEQELKIVRDSTESARLKEDLEMLQKHSAALRRKQAFLEGMRRTLTLRLENEERRAVPDPETPEEWFEARAHPNEDGYTGDIDSAPLTDHTNEFNNRFVVHNAQIKWNNSLRNIILRYIHQVSQRRGFVYYMSRRAVKFILDILEEQKQSKVPTGSAPTPGKRHSEPATPSSFSDGDGTDVRDRIEQLLSDTKKFVDADDPENSPTSARKHDGDNMDQDIGNEFTAQNSYHVRLIAPQIQLQSEKSAKSAVLVTAKSMQLKVIQIMDRDRVTDDVSGLVQRRFAAAMDSVQFFVTSTKTFSTEYLHMYSGNRYGTPAGASWPPWVPVEVMFEFQNNPYGFHRVVQRTSASLRYDKYNTLRLKYNDDVTGTAEPGQGSEAESPEHRMDHLWIDFPHLRAICDSAQYYAMYVIVMDLLMYSEPLEKTRSERLEKIMLASDFSDLTGAPELVIMLQERIRQLEEIKMHFQINEKYLDKRGWLDRISIDQDLAVCEDELFFMMKAITTSQRRVDDKGTNDQSNGLLRWYLSASEIAWHLIREKNESLLEFQLRNASYERTDNNDGSNYNSMQIESMKGLNLLPDALYPEIIKPYVDTAKSMAESRDTNMLSVHWYMLEAIAGIPVVDHFEVNLVPLQVQLEREVGTKLFEYVFPGAGTNAFENGGFSPFMVKHMQPAPDEGEENDVHRHGSITYASTESSNVSSPQPDANTGAGQGSLQMRLQPTLTLPERRPKTSSSAQKTGKDNNYYLGFFQHNHRPKTATPRGFGAQGKAVSSDSLSSMARPKADRNLSNVSSVNSSTGEVGSGTEKTARSGRFLHRNGSKDQRDKDKGPQQSDELTQMINRASNYMTLAYFKVTSVVLCLSYKGKGNRNIEDVHDLVFRMPTIEYRNKTWSNLDLALQLKKDVIRALISHAGAIVGNKLSHHRPNKAQQSRLREIANSSTFLSSSDFNRTSSGDHVNLRGHPLEEDDDNDDLSIALSSEPRQSFASSSRGREMVRVDSWSSSMKSGNITPPGGLTSTTHSLQRSTTQSSSNSGFQGPSIQSANRNRPGLGIELTPATPTEAPSSGEVEREFPRINTLQRRFSELSQRLRQGDSGQGEEENDASSRRKSKLLLGGKKFLNSIPH